MSEGTIVPKNECLGDNFSRGTIFMQCYIFTCIMNCHLYAFWVWSDTPLLWDKCGSAKTGLAQL